MRILHLLLLTLIAVVLVAPPAAADDIVLQDWLFNVDGTIYNPDPLPGYFNAAGFDFTQGLGTIMITYNPGPGTHFLIGYFDHDIVGPNNVLENETGAAHGTPGATESYEIDEPGFTTGDLVMNALAGTLDNLPAVGDTFGPDDVAMALGYSFTLGADEQAFLRFVASTTAPAAGFYLQQTDPNGTNVYLSSALDIRGTGPNPIPEPASIFLLGVAVTVAGWKLRKRCEGR